MMWSQAGALDGADIILAGLGARRLEGVARLVGELAEVHLVGVGGSREHADVGAGAENPVLAGLHHHGLHFRMLEAQPLHGIGKLDVDAEVVGIELQFVAVEETGGRIDVHREMGDLAFAGHPPVAVLGRVGLEIDALGHAGLPKDRF